MLRPLKDLGAGLQALVAVLSALLSWLEDMGAGVAEGLDLRDRVEALERSRAEWEGEATAALTRAEARFGAARAAENRARHMERNIARAGEGDEEGDSDDAIAAYLETMARGNATGGGGEEVQPVRNGVASRADQKARLRQAKFSGRG